MPPEKDKKSAAHAAPAPAPVAAATVPGGSPSVIIPPAPPPPAPPVDPLPGAVRELLAAVPRDIAGLPGSTPASYERYLKARAAVEALLQ